MRVCGVRPEVTLPSMRRRAGRIGPVPVLSRDSRPGPWRGPARALNALRGGPHTTNPTHQPCVGPHSPYTKGAQPHVVHLQTAPAPAQAFNAPGATVNGQRSNSPAGTRSWAGAALWARPYPAHPRCRSRTQTPYGAAGTCHEPRAGTAGRARRTASGPAATRT